MKSLAEIREFVPQEFLPCAAAVVGVALYISSAYWVSKQTERSMDDPVSLQTERSTPLPAHSFNTFLAGQERHTIVITDDVVTNHPHQRGG
jgi:hypothetical protein